jgi:hypothetical protein
MTDIAVLQSQLESLKAAYRTGATSIQYDGKQISYRDSQGMLQAIAAIEDEIAQASGAAPVHSFVVRSEKGW